MCRADGRDAFTKMAFINALFFAGLESSKFKPLSGTKQRVDARLMYLYTSLTAETESSEVTIYIISVGSACCSFRQRKGIC